MKQKAKNKSIGIRLSLNRFKRLEAYATARDKTMTALIEDWIDTLPDCLETSKPSAKDCL